MNRKKNIRKFANNKINSLLKNSNLSNFIFYSFTIIFIGGFFIISLHIENKCNNLSRNKIISKKHQIVALKADLDEQKIIKNKLLYANSKEIYEKYDMSVEIEPQTIYIGID